MSRTGLHPRTPDNGRPLGLFGAAFGLIGGTIMLAGGLSLSCWKGVSGVREAIASLDASPGDAGSLVDDALSHLTAGSVALLILLAFAWSAVQAGPVVDRLAARSGAVAFPQRRWATLAMVALLLVPLSNHWLGRAPEAVVGQGFLWACAACFFAAVLAFFAAHRRHSVETAWAHLDAVRPIALREVSTREGGLELAVVGTGRTAGVVDGWVHAWVDLRVYDLAPTNHPDEALRARSCWPAELRVRDAHDEAVLEVADAALDLRASHAFFTGADLRRKLAAGPFAALCAGLGSAHYDSWRVEQNALDADERIYVLTAVPNTQSAAEIPYRGAPPTARSDGRGGAPIFVHAGTADSLRGVVRVERACLRVVVTCAAAIFAVMAVLSIALRARI